METGETTGGDWRLRGSARTGTPHRHAVWLYSFHREAVSFKTLYVAYAQNLRLRFDVLTKTKKPELHRYWTTRDRAANLRLFRLVSEILRAIEAGVFHPVVGWQCQECPYRSRCWAWG